MKKNLLTLYVLVAFAIIPARLFSQTVLVAENESWKYLDNGSNQNTAWRLPEYDDSSWKTGMAELGYGDGDEKTIVSYGPNSGQKYITTYFRKSFSVADPTVFTAIEIGLKRDDGAVVYINGNEVFRSNMPDGDILYKTPAVYQVGSSFETTWFTSLLENSKIKSGVNTIAVEVHQSSSNADLTFNLKLNGLTNTQTCGILKDLKAGTTTSSSAQLSWSAIASATSYLVQYRVNGTTTWTSKTTNSNSIQIGNLSAVTNYEYRIQATCSAGKSSYSPIANFTTKNTYTLVDLVVENESWKYLDNGTNPGISWQSNLFDDAAWKSGVAELGYGDGDEKTVVSFGPKSYSKYITTYFRKTLNIPDKSNFTGLEISLLRDDGAVVYLNGNEVFRSNMPEGSIDYKTLASTAAGASTEASYFTKNTGPEFLVNGANIIAVEVHQLSADNADLSFNFKLKGTISDVSCGTPSNLSSDSLTLSTAKLLWTKVADAKSYNIQYRTLGNSTWSTTSSITNSVKLSGLTQGYQYEFSVQALCTSSGLYSAPAVFSTACPAPSNLIVKSVNASSATLKWKTVSGINNYKVQYRAVGNSSWQTVSSSSDSIIINSLSPLTNYEAAVQTVCSSNQSSFSSGVNFKTTEQLTNPQLISSGDSWKYLDNGTDQGTLWKLGTYDDSGWKSGNSELGYGDGDEQTIVSYGPKSTSKYITTYFRKSIYVPDTTMFAKLEINLIRDDGAIIYINGQEVVRSNMPTGTVTSQTLAAAAAGIPEESTYQQFRINSSVLKKGSNLIAVEIHQASVDNADISFNLNMRGLTAAQASCKYPENRRTGYSTPTSTTILWDSLEAVIYKIAYRQKGTTEWKYTTSRDHSKSLYGLLGSTTYEYKVQTACSATEASDYSPIGTLTTKSFCANAPAKLFASSIDTNAAILSWSDVSSTVTYTVHYRISGSDTWITLPIVSTNSVNVSGLTSSTNYEFQVKTNCSSTSSTYSLTYAFTTASRTSPTPTALNVYVNSVLSNLSSNAVGINMNYLLDDDAGNSPEISTRTALSNMGVKFLRFPGGEKSDSYLWSVPPYNSATHTLGRSGPFEWPANDNLFVENDFRTLKNNTMNFDEFISVSQSLGATSLIVVAYDATFGPATPGSIVPTKEQLLQNAEEWVRYANVKKGYGIKHWMIGNESYIVHSNNGYTTKEKYRDDVIDFSKRMKAVDPTIKIIVNGENTYWWQTLLEGASRYIDYLAVNNFPVRFTGGYEYYSNNSPTLTSSVSKAVNAIYAYAPAADQSRIKVIVTEYNAIDWDDNWENKNDLGHSMFNFETLGEQLKMPTVEASNFWSSHWVDNSNTTEIGSAIEKSGNLSPNGKAVSIWGNFRGQKMVYTTSTPVIRSFASYNPGDQKLYLYFINKGKQNTPVTVNLQNYLTSASGKIRTLKGQGPFDRKPTWTETGTVNLSGTSLSLSLASVSITVVELSPSGSARMNQSNAVEIQDSKETLANQLKVYPNPNNGFVHIEYAHDSEFSICIKNIQGQKVFEKSYSKGVDEHIDISNCAAGLYFIQMQSETHLITKKILIEK